MARDTRLTTIPNRVLNLSEKDGIILMFKGLVEFHGENPWVTLLKIVRNKSLSESLLTATASSGGGWAASCYRAMASWAARGPPIFMARAVAKALAALLTT